MLTLGYMAGRSLTRFAWLSIVGALLTIGLKMGAYLLTGSVGVLSDALESLVNLVAGGQRAGGAGGRAAPGRGASYGYEKAEYFSSGFEGALILVAAPPSGWRRWGAWRTRNRSRRAWGWRHGAAALINLGIARVLLDASRRYGSITLEADARHLLSDVWTSAG